MTSKFDKVRAEQLEYNAKREKGYREKALKMYPWVCGRCAREFTHKNLSELTVHHVNHDHDHNPSDGSNWELLCVYCHDEEHTKFENLVRYGSTSETEVKPATFNPFADLKAKMNSK
ncbi:YajD family HNH nuclease [Agaribacterium sp. ZY112]|uniref:YajD family HNH nuclease n=1 Tax=Agaribacterium sp. ZY112 TaxID=3233574 RepID=UPI00352437FF